MGWHFVNPNLQSKITFHLTLFCEETLYFLICLFEFRCMCGKCQPMTSAIESRCCRESEPFWKLAEDLQPRPDDITCLTQHPGFEGCCLNPFVLQIAYLAFRQDHGPLNVWVSCAIWNKQDMYLSYCSSTWMSLAGLIKQNLSLPASTATQHTVRLSAGPMGKLVATIEGSYLHVSSTPSETSFPNNQVEPTVAFYGPT